MASKWKKGAMKAAADKEPDEKPAPKKKGSPLHDNPRSPKE